MFSLDEVSTIPEKARLSTQPPKGKYQFYTFIINQEFKRSYSFEQHA